MGPRKQHTGGARLELTVPPIATSGATVPVRMALRAGEKPLAIEGVELTLEICPEEEGSEEPGVEEIGSMPGSKGISLAPGEEKLLEWEATLPECQLLYLEDPTRYAQLVLESGEEGDPTLWSAEEPLPMMTGWECKTVVLAAEIPGTDVAARAGVHVIPEAAGLLRPAGIMSGEEFAAALTAAAAYRVFVSSVGEQWFAWWSAGGGRVVAYSPVKAVCSVRPEGVVRSHTNPRIPVPSRLEKLASETADVVQGGMDEARELAERLIAEAGAGVLLPRVVGNAWFALTGLMIVR